MIIDSLEEQMEARKNRLIHYQKWWFKFVKLLVENNVQNVYEISTMIQPSEHLKAYVFD